jgi:hypothetical protein
LFYYIIFRERDQGGKNFFSFTVPPLSHPEIFPFYRGLLQKDAEKEIME